MKTSLEILEDELKKVWSSYYKSGPINGLHTEIEIEPRAFVGDDLNPQLADILASVYLSKTTIDDLKNGSIEIRDEAIVIKDKATKKPVAIVRSQKLIRDFKNKLTR